jgi:dolichol-phosphate mannosyltransferase
MAGFRAAHGEIAVTLDADLQNDPADIPLLLAKMGDYDAVCGVRAGRRDSWIRRVSSRIGNGFRNWVTGDRVTDTGCSLKAYRRAHLLCLPPFRGMHRFLPTLLRMLGHSVCEVDVNHRARAYGEAKYGVWNRMFRGLRDCFGVRWLRSRALKYEIAEEQ